MNPAATARALDFAQACIDQQQPGEFVETFVQTATTLKVRYEANQLKDATVREARGLAIRLRDAQGRSGSFATSDFADPAGTLEMARNLAALGEPAEYEPLKAYHPADVQTTSPAAEHRTPASLVEDGAEMLANVREAIPAGLHEIELFHTLTGIELANSLGAQARFTHADYSGYLVTSVTRPDDQLEAYELMQAAGGEVDLAGPVERMAAKVNGCERGANLAPGAYPVLFTPNSLSLFFALTNALNGKPVVEGLSTLRNALGTQALSPLLSLTDDPTLAEGPMSYPCDDEGEPARVTALIDAGTVRGFLFDRRWGTKAGSGSTGHGLRCGRMTLGAGRSYQNDIHPHGSNTVIGAGTVAREALLHGMKRGLIVDSVMGVHTTNPISGDFSVNLDLALVVENGEIVGRLKDAMLSGNTFTLLRDRLQALSAERYWVGSTLAPWFLVDGVHVSTSG